MRQPKELLEFIQNKHISNGKPLSTSVTLDSKRIIFIIKQTIALLVRLPS